MIRTLFGALRSRVFVMLHDLLWVPISVYLAYQLRFSPGEIPPPHQTAMLWTIAVAVPVFAFTFWLFSLYRGLWRFISFLDLTRLLKAVVLGVLVTAVLLFVLRRAEGVPRSILVLFPLMLTLGLTGPRMLYRWLRELGFGADRPARKRALIVGAGSVGELLIRRLQRDGSYVPTALVDPNPRMVGKEIHGVRVVGTLAEAPRVLETERIEAMILAAPVTKPGELNELVAECAIRRIPCRTVPQRAFFDDRLVEDINLRPITIEDLLCREPIVLDSSAIAQHLRGQRVLLTGGGGSIGSELCRQVAAQEPSQLVVIESSEYNLYQIEQNLHARFPRLDLHAILADVSREASMEAVFRRFAPEIVFHAAAYKHVPLLEANPLQAVQTNVLGTKVVADAAHRYHCDRFVLISTDKAVNPTNVMGTTKRIAELYCQNVNARSETRFITTRFGNVLGSIGSVVPLFESQIAQGGPVTVTHPEIRRFFMTISEATSLILQACGMGRGGEIFVLDMGQPVKIRELAEQMIRLAGFTPYADIPIVFTGLRAGEKLFEEPFYENEGLIGTPNPKILLATQRQLDWGWLEGELAELQKVVGNRDPAALLPLLRRVVPEFTPAPFQSAEAAERPSEPRLRVVH